MKTPTLLIILAGCLLAQGPDYPLLLNPTPGTWPLYYGDYSGRRFSPLAQINRTNVSSMTLAWTFRTKAIAIPTGDAGLDRNALTLTSVPIAANGALYLTLADNVWAIEARTGSLIWHFYRPAPGNHAVNRGVGISRDRVFWGTADSHVVCLDIHNGKKLWDVAVGDVTFGEAITMAPLVVRNHVIVGSSGDGADVPGFATALDPANGSVQWRWDAVPKPGQPGAETWPSGRVGKDIMAHGGGNPPMTPTYDPILNLLYIGTGSPRPTMAGNARPGANLYTSSIVAINADSGKMAWYFQASPHDTHGWGATETPVLFDADFKGNTRKLLAQANRNGYLFVLDRSTGENLLSVPFVPVTWSAGPDTRGRPVPREDREPRPDGVLVSPDGFGATSWLPSYDPDTKLLYVTTRTGGYAMFYQTSRAATPRGWAGVARPVGRPASVLSAIEYETGRIRWSSGAGGLGGVLSTAGGLVFTSGSANNLVAVDAETGKVLWHAKAGAMANSAMTYELDGKQYLVTPVEDTVYTWTLPVQRLAGRAY